ncbi:MAG: CBS domain-containing protein [Leptospira sp.]|jgi:CBS domain-containing protein|nr:CBS domain-containing protein [Leptospira sp.]
MLVKDILKDKPVTLLSIDEGKSVLEATQLMVDAKVGSIIVTNNGKLSGIFTERDLMRVVAKEHANVGNVLLKSVMTSQLTVASPSDDIDNILNTMVSKKFRHMPVLDGDNIVGLISIGDAIKTKLTKTQAEMSILREYMYGSQ